VNRVYDIWIPINPGELGLCRWVASSMINNVLANDRSGKGHGEPGFSMDGRDLPGACGELIFHKGFGLYWGGGLERTDSWSRGDFGKCEVRSTTWESGHLVCYDADADDKELFLVTLNQTISQGVVSFSGGFIKGHLSARAARLVGTRKKPGDRGFREGSKPQVWVAQQFLRQTFGRKQILEAAA
jgi:hypothetical protein